jgi:hypothetical protein
MLEACLLGGANGSLECRAWPAFRRACAAGGISGVLLERETSALRIGAFGLKVRQPAAATVAAAAVPTQTLDGNAPGVLPRLGGRA